MQDYGMAKLSRRKRQPPPTKTEVPKPFDMRKFYNERMAGSEAGFAECRVRLRSLMVRFAVEDVLICLNVSDLWLPNVSAQVKHQLAFATYLSIPPVEFGAQRVSSYEDFVAFSRELISCLPQFPSAEDYWPEDDWGDVLFTDVIDARPSLYGGCVQRIYDFIEAFRILYSDTREAVEDMRYAQRMQARLVELVPRPDHALPQDVHTGHIEVAAQPFWEAMRLALPAHVFPSLTAGLLAIPGTPTKWNTVQQFGNGVMSGEIIPWLGVQLGEIFLPVSLRNAPAVVLDFWHRRGKVSRALAAARFTEFMALRVKERAFIAGPVYVVNPYSRASRALAAVLPSESAHHLVMFCEPSELPEIDKSIAEMRRLVRENPQWGFVRAGSHEGFQLRDDKGSNANERDLEFIVVVGLVTTKPTALRVPKKKEYRFVSIVDAVTLFDAMKDSEELTRFWKYESGLRAMGGGGMSDLADLFGSFRDSHGQIIDGALVPNMIMLDAHWGANWRYAQLRDYWSGAPRNFPDAKSAWDTKESKGKGSLRRVIARNGPRLAWSSRLGDCTMHFVLDVDLVGLKVDDGQVLETFTHCAADCLAQRETLVQSMLTLPYRRIVVECVVPPGWVATVPDDVKLAVANAELLKDWTIMVDDSPQQLHARVAVNLARILSRLSAARDASFEAECAAAILEILSHHVRGRPLDEAERDAITATGAGRPRFVMRTTELTVDVPNHGEPDQPTLENFKVARRKLAELLMAQGVAPGRYELGEAKKLINAARAAYRDMVHERLRSFDRESFIRYCVEQIDAASAEYDRKVMRHRQSLEHEIEYDRERSQADAHETFTRDTKNFRYAIEAALFLTSPRHDSGRPSEILEVIGMIDWLLVLYNASDVLHNGVEVGGLLVDSQYVPEVFFSSGRDAQEDQFSREMAALRLGQDVEHEDKLDEPFKDETFVASLDAAFLTDLGFGYRDLLKTLATLISWVTLGGAKEFAFSYTASSDAIVRSALGAFDDLKVPAAREALEFLILRPEDVRRLAGSKQDTEDVPVWEHTKRVNRYTIKPVIRLADGQLLWGASMADRARRIWVGMISDGYLPADFPWPAVRAIVGKAKKALEDQLEDAAYEVCARLTPYAVKGLDFKDRFPKQGFDDVGDFDVLAYWPQGNRWLIGECKYNQPPFCVKDTRRLRDRIFGGGSEMGQFVKIERRRRFFADNIDLIRELLGWPQPATPLPDVTELYISKDLHWWLRFPPYKVPTQFTQIDTMAAWLAAKGFTRAGEAPLPAGTEAAPSRNAFPGG